MSPDIPALKEVLYEAASKNARTTTLPRPYEKEEKIFIFSSFDGLSSAQDKTRTCTAERPLPPQSSVYTNFTTWAFLVVQI